MHWAAAIREDGVEHHQEEVLQGSGNRLPGDTFSGILILFTWLIPNTVSSMFFSFRDSVVLHYLSNPYLVSLSPVGQSHNQCLRKRTQTQISTHICFSGIKSLFYFY